MTEQNIRALAMADASYAVAYCNTATSKEELKESVRDLERLYNSELMAYKNHQMMNPAAYSGVYVFNNEEACVYRNTRANAYLKAIRRIKDVLQNMN